MRTCLFAAISSLAACAADPSMMGDDDGSGSGSGSGSDMLEPPARGFQIKTPDITIEAHQEITYCYYFKTPNTEAYTIKRWASTMTTGSHHLILFTTPQLGQPEGTISATSCSITGGGGGANIASWVYSAQTASADLPLPADDGTGKPVGMDIAAGQAGFVQMHYNNTGDAPLVASAVINAEAYDVGVATTKTFAYVTYDGDINIPGGGAPHTESMDCNISPSSKVWLMSTHAHRLATHTEVRNGATVTFQSDDWEHPGATKWMDAPFYSYSSGKLTSSCTWSNPGSGTVYAGDSANTEEMCMASGYYFPATKSTICYNGFTF